MLKQGVLLGWEGRGLSLFPPPGDHDPPPENFPSRNVPGNEGFNVIAYFYWDMIATIRPVFYFFN